MRRDIELLMLMPQIGVQIIVARIGKFEIHLSNLGGNSR